MCYLVFPEDSSMRINYGLIYMAFIDDDSAQEYARIHGLRAFVFDCLDFLGFGFIED